MKCTEQLWEIRRANTKYSGGMDMLLDLLDEEAKTRQVVFHCEGGKHKTGIKGLADRYLQSPDFLYNRSEQHNTHLYKDGIGSVRNDYAEGRLFNPAEIEYFSHNTVEARDENLKSMDLLFKLFYEESFSGRVSDSIRDKIKKLYPSYDDEKLTQYVQRLKEIRKKFLNRCNLPAVSAADRKRLADFVRNCYQIFKKSFRAHHPGASSAEFSNSNEDCINQLDAMPYSDSLSCPRACE
ncbi:MAG: hypothetical protein HQK53_08600 [Oligoflexia bacterium]|nr:hypothetical protein [Oligoflexia bacterium]